MRRGLLCLGLCLCLPAAWAQSTGLVLAASAETAHSGLLPWLLPRFEAISGIDVRVLASTAEAALAAGRAARAGIVLVNDPVAEQGFVAHGFAQRRQRLMYNDWVLLGPRNDPAGVRGPDIAAAFKRLALSGATLLSSGESGAEARLWALSGADPRQTPTMHYRRCACDTATALRLAADAQAYVLADRASWLAFEARDDLVLLVEGDRELGNVYSLLLVDAADPAQKAMARALADWLVSEEAQDAIANFKLRGRQVYFPNAVPGG